MTKHVLNPTQDEALKERTDCWIGCCGTGRVLMTLNLKAELLSERDQMLPKRSSGRFHDAAFRRNPRLLPLFRASAELVRKKEAKPTPRSGPFVARPGKQAAKNAPLLPN